MALFWIITLVLVTLSHGFDRTRLWKIPPPMKGFQIQPALGRWYYQFRIAPCSWSGSNEFTDYEVLMTLQGKSTIVFSRTMRNDGICNTVTSKAYLTSQPGVINIKDPLGNNFSGLQIFTATDYKTFSITYTCTKKSVSGDKCDDAMVNVRTRMRKPGLQVIQRINNALMQLWGVTLEQFQRVLHSKPCFYKW
ncbi:hypothetical protein ACF0H5_009535 [Mactra antiquata]